MPAYVAGANIGREFVWSFVTRGFFDLLSISNALYVTSTEISLSVACYAVQKKNMNSYGQYLPDGSGITGYEPTIWITTKKIGSAIQITIKDNGTGISDHVKTKIFQSFFATKPTGEGTGLGLSLTYDIVK